MATSAGRSNDVTVLAATQQHARTNHVHRRRRGGARRAARLAGGLAGGQALWMLVGVPRAPAALSAFFSSVSRSPPPPTTTATACPTSSAATTYRSRPTRCCRRRRRQRQRRGGGAAANASGWLGANQTRALAGLIAGGAALATLHAPHYASALLGPAASTATRRSRRRWSVRSASPKAPRLLAPPRRLRRRRRAARAWRARRRPRGPLRARRYPSDARPVGQPPRCEEGGGEDGHRPRSPRAARHPGRRRVGHRRFGVARLAGGHRHRRRVGEEWLAKGAACGRSGGED